MVRHFFVLGVLALCVTAVRADKVTLSTGEVFEGTITVHDVKNKKIKFKHSILGEFEISLDQVQAMDDQEPKASPPPPPKWTQRLELGLNGSEGNSQAFNLYGSYRANYADEDERIKVDASYFLNKSDSVTTKEKFTAGLLKDWLLPESKWFYFAQTRFDSDKFAKYDRRVSASAGVGYDWIKQDDLRVTLRGGLGAARETGSGDRSIQPEGQLGGEVEWKISKGQSLSGAITYYPDLEDLSEFRTEGSVEWRVRLEDGASFKLGVKDEYESSVNPGIKHNDLTYYAALVFDF